MINNRIFELSQTISGYMEDSNKRNTLKNYWYPLNIATYGVEEVLEAVDSMCSYQTSMSEKTRIFEKEFGKRFGGEAIMVNSGSSADLLMMFSLNEKSGGPLRMGDEVLVPAVTWPTQLWSVVMAGFKAKLVDIDPETLNISTEKLEKSITEATKAVFIVHLMGNTSNLDEIQRICDKYNLILIEDCCESLGAKWKNQLVGTFGVASSFSFFFSHHITTMEGGMILTRDEMMAEKFRLLRAHGWSRNLAKPSKDTYDLDNRYTFLDWGFNVRPTELQAGFGIVQLKKFDNFQINRLKNVSYAKKRILKHKKYISLMRENDFTSCSWFALPFLVTDTNIINKNNLINFLERNGVETRPIVAGNLARQPAFNKFPEIMHDDLTNSNTVHDNGFYIGLYPIQSIDELKRVFDLFDEFFSNL